MIWDYAALSHEAKECGGPAALMNLIEGRGFQEGFGVGEIGRASCRERV